MASESIFDREHLARYTLGDPNLEREVLGLFFGQVPGLLATLRTSSEAGEWLRAAHSIKGSARAVGAWKLAGAAERAEQGVARDERLEPKLADDIERALEELRACVCHEAGQQVAG